MPMVDLNRLTERFFGDKVTVRLAVASHTSHVVEVQRRAWPRVIQRYAEGGVIHATPGPSGFERVTFGTVYRGQTYLYGDKAAFEDAVNSYHMVDHEFAASPSSPTDALIRVMKSLDRK